jgi:hypothetical protein
MKRHLNRIWILILPFLISACSGMRYQVYTMASDLPKDVNKEYAFETDSLAVAYSFAVEDGQLSMGVFNTSDKPLYINWKNSAFILNSQSTPMMHFTGYESEIIPPASLVVFAAPLNQFYIENFRDQPLVNRGTLTRTGSQFGDVFRYRNFVKSNTPLKVRTHVQISINEGFEDPLILDHDFWLQSIEEFYLWETVLWQTSTIIGGDGSRRKPEKFIIPGYHSSPVGGCLATTAIVVGLFVIGSTFDEN